MVRLIKRIETTDLSLYLPFIFPIGIARADPKDAPSEGRWERWRSNK